MTFKRILSEEGVSENSDEPANSVDQSESIKYTIKCRTPAQAHFQLVSALTLFRGQSEAIPGILSFTEFDRLYYFLDRYTFFKDHTYNFLAMNGSLPHFLQPISSDRALEALTNSMWSTMMVTGIIFTLVLFVFLGIRVGRSIVAESTDTGPLEISFLFSFSGIRYIHNHARHHLFQTPLIPRRRFSSLSAPWLPGFLKRASFTSRNSDIFSEENGLSSTFDKSRRNSSSVSDSNSYRKSSASSKSKRLSVPHIQAPKNVNNAVAKPSPTTEINDSSKPISRRNTLPNLPITTELSAKQNAEQLITEKTVNQVNHPLTGNIDDTSVLQAQTSLSIICEQVSIANPVQKEEPKIHTEVKLMPIIEEESLDELEDDLSVFGDIISEDSESFTETYENNDKVKFESVAIEESTKSISNLSQSPSFSQVGSETSSPKPSSFRSAYFNYLPESIFGYSKSTLKSSMTSGSPPKDSFNAPPGFSKRSASHDFTNKAENGFPNSNGDEFTNHQPLYARRRTETSRILSEAAKSFLPFNLPSLSSNSMTSDSPPSRSNTASPCLSDLQNTDDLFAPINWNFSSSDRSEALRRSWDAAEVEEKLETQSKNNDSSSYKRKSTSFSSLFEGY